MCLKIGFVPAQAGGSSPSFLLEPSLKPVSKSAVPRNGIVFGVCLGLWPQPSVNGSILTAPELHPIAKTPGAFQSWIKPFGPKSWTKPAQLRKFLFLTQLGVLKSESVSCFFLSYPKSGHPRSKKTPHSTLQGLSITQHANQQASFLGGASWKNGPLDPWSGPMLESWARRPGSWVHPGPMGLFRELPAVAPKRLPSLELRASKGGKPGVRLGKRRATRKFPPTHVAGLETTKR